MNPRNVGPMSDCRTVGRSDMPLSQGGAPSHTNTYINALFSPLRETPMSDGPTNVRHFRRPHLDLS
jgi:hypothetical protein